MTVEQRIRYVVTVKCPDEVWTQYGDSQEFDRMFCEATKGSLDAGIDTFCDVEMHAEFLTTKQAEEADNNLLQLIRHFQRKLKESKDETL